MFNPYGLTAALGLLSSYFIIEWVLVRRQLKWDTTVVLGCTWIFALVGARGYHVLTDWQLYQDAGLMELIAVWNGGIGWIGAIVGGLMGMLVGLSLEHQLSKWRVLVDAIALSLPVGQSIGRIGNYFNQELYGRATNLPWGISIDQTRLPIGYGSESRFHPLFAYEIVLNLCLFLFLLIFFIKNPNKLGQGIFAGFYLIGYGLIRFGLEFLRFETARVGFFTQLSIAQLMMVVWILSGVAMVYLRKR